MKTPEQYRIKKGVLKSDSTNGNNGAFEIPFSLRTKAFVIASDGYGWEHVSVHVMSDGKERTPTWSEMCKIKEMFWDDSDSVVQFHPKRSEYVNQHKHCLHLWKKIGVEYELPPIYLV